MRALTVFAVLAFAGPALAQDPAEDWDLTVDAARQLTMATVDFGENLIALRCQAGALDLLLTGVPASAGATRRVQISAGAIVDESQAWVAQAGQPVLGADEPARLARQLRAGTEMTLRLDRESDADQARRYRFPVPASAASVDAVLTACGEPLVEPRDGFTRLSAAADAPIWTVAPRTEFPDTPSALSAGAGVVLVSCVIAADWGLQDCRADAENPRDAGFGASAVRAARAARVGPPPNGADTRGRLIRFSIRFMPPEA